MKNKILIAVLVVLVVINAVNLISLVTRKEKDPCIFTAAKGVILEVNVLDSKNILVSVVGQGSDKVQKVEFASTTDATKIKAGKELKVCYVI